jgi:hypothetical protein
MRLFTLAVVASSAIAQSLPVTKITVTQLPIR